ncbi:MAG: hypothetical protein M1830_008031 [Pleopsidium flavum]|nr:MAG: hypothetical protein M1830_008031 [Pleopsidium flavum]
MPPRIHGSVIKAQLSLCQSCCAVTSAGRAFSLSSPTLKIGPESPKFIEVPQPLQPRSPPKRRIKGILPVPRNLFPRRGADKTSPEYLAAATPEPSSTKDASILGRQPTEAADFIVWKERMAAIRRRNLREGLVELQHRKQRTDRQVAGRSAYKRAEHERLVHREKRDDERLTDPTITDSMKNFQKGIVPDPDRLARIEQKRAMVQAKESAKQEERRDALHTLYMNAGTFITTEDQLQMAIDRAFTTEPNSAWYNSASSTTEAESVWNLGLPETVQQMLGKANRTGNKAMEYNEGFAKVTGERIRRIAEELTGGKM